jgi:hypothetical protein
LQKEREEREKADQQIFENFFSIQERPKDFSKKLEKRMSNFTRHKIIKEEEPEPYYPITKKDIKNRVPQILGHLKKVKRSNDSLYNLFAQVGSEARTSKNHNLGYYGTSFESYKIDQTTLS